MDSEIEIGLQKIIKQLSEQFGNELDLKGILFLIGVQELGKMRQKYSKNEKLELMHIAVCKLLTTEGYYTYTGTDKEGWPHYELNEAIPTFRLKEQEELLKKQIVIYFEEHGLI